MSKKSSFKAANVIFALFLAGCAPDPHSPIIDQNSLTTSDRNLVIASVVGSLKDPHHAHLRLPPIAKRYIGDDEIHYCGCVNARNSYGGYTGYQPFYGKFYTSTNAKKNFEVLALGDSKDHERDASKQCRIWWYRDNPC